MRIENGVTYLRPFLALRRADMLNICEAEGVAPWNDPTNTDQTLMRARIRHTILPFLQEHLGGMWHSPWREPPQSPGLMPNIWMRSPPLNTPA